MKKGLLFIFGAFVTLIACKNDPKSNVVQPVGDTAQENPTVLAGHWIAMDFCSRAQQYGSVLAAMNNGHVPYVYGFTFNPGEPDSVECSNGMETWKLKVKFKVDTVEMVNARQGKSVFLVYDSKGNREIVMFDVTTGVAQTDRFLKSKAGTRDAQTAFLTALNHNLFDGSFHAVGKGAAADKIMFTPGGFIEGMKQYDRYEVCTAGDCFVVNDHVDVITLSNHAQENSAKMYGFTYNGGNDTLSIVNLINNKPAEKGAYSVGSVAFKLARVKK
jgi:hypothetical protein